MEVKILKKLYQNRPCLHFKWKTGKTPTSVVAYNFHKT